MIEPLPASRSDRRRALPPAETASKASGPVGHAGHRFPLHGSGTGSGQASGGHGCFATEATCDGKCVDTNSNAQHCGACGNACTGMADRVGSCIDGKCEFQCNAGFVDDNGVCKNFFGAHEAFPNDCLGCNVPNAITGMCSCPSPSAAISLAVQSDCPGNPLRASTRLNLCATSGVSDQSDFGGAFQVDDLDGWCGATAKCRVGNPMLGGACGCPAGFDEAIGLRSIIRLPCDAGEVGTVIVVCGNKDVPTRTVGGAYQFDDIDPQCRIANPWTGGCSCPAGTTDRVYRVMVDGGAGLYGSTIHLCTL